MSMRSFIGSQRTAGLSSYHTHELALQGGQTILIREGGAYVDTDGTRGKEDQTGFYIWGASVALAQWMATTSALRAEIENSTVYELGAGCGLPGFAAALGGARRVVLTDLRGATLANLRHNVQINQEALQRCELEVCELDWAQDTLMTPAHVVLGADLVYDDETWPLLVPVVKRLTAPGGIFLHAYPVSYPSPMRTGPDEFAEELSRRGFRLEVECEAPQA